MFRCAILRYVENLSLTRSPVAILILSLLFPLPSAFTSDDLLDPSTIAGMSTEIRTSGDSIQNSCGDLYAVPRISRMRYLQTYG